MPLDLATELFILLRGTFFDPSGQPIVFPLRDKRNTQDDPLDEYISEILSTRLPESIKSTKAPGPLITPDLVIFRPDHCNKTQRTVLKEDLNRILAIEVKKLERTTSGGIARSSGLDYNTTPPCGTVRVYDWTGRPLDIRGFYLFVCQEPVAEHPGSYQLTALVLCDGNLLNKDFDYYLSIVGQRSKTIDLGTYGDGANRIRPMLIFSNPLGFNELDHAATLIHEADFELDAPQLETVGEIKRTTVDGKVNSFRCYRLTTDIPRDLREFQMLDPFPSPNRTLKTVQRGRFRVHVHPSD